MGVIDLYRFEKRIEPRTGNADYVLMRTSCCGQYCVEEDELSDLYFAQNDLLKRVTLLRAGDDTSMFACPMCGAAEWDLAEVAELADVPDEWRWACWPR
jgi:hypothetical protein